MNTMQESVMNESQINPTCPACEGKKSRLYISDMFGCEYRILCSTCKGTGKAPDYHPSVALQSCIEEEGE